MELKKLYKLWVIILLFISTNAFAVSHEISTSTTSIYGTSMNPGDTIKLLSGQREFLYFDGIHGNSASPIVIINEGGQVVVNAINPGTYGIKFKNCSYIKLTGSGHINHQYGIHVDGVTFGTGVSVDNLSTNFEMERVEISDIQIAGMYVKTDPTCTTLESTRENFTMYDIRIHDCYLHDIGDEGMYIGSSKYTGYDIGCGTLLPHVIEGVKVYNNIVENTGWDGIQVSSASSDCFIYNNTIRNDSYKEHPNQMSGILIGGGSECDCYNNKIFDGKGDGIDVFGLGNHKIYNNLIVRAGVSYLPDDELTHQDYKKHGIYVGIVPPTQTVNTTTPNAEILIYNNTIINPKTYGITGANVSISSYKIYNNIISEPSSYSVLENNPFFNINILINHQRTNNLFSNLEDDFKFIDPAIDNYDIDAFSLAVNSGRNMSEYGLSFDIDNKLRPFGVAFDIGAYESHDSRISIEEGNLYTNKGIILYDVSPNPISGTALIKYELKEALFIRLSIIDLSGKTVRLLVSERQEVNMYTAEIQKNNLPAGIYFITLESKFGKISKRIIFI